MKAYSSILLVLFVAVAGHTVMGAQCDGKSTTLDDNMAFLCDMMTSFVFRGTLAGGVSNVNQTIPANNQREDVFTSKQIFKDTEGSMTGATQVSVIYHYSSTSSCPEFPYDQDNMEMILYGVLDSNKMHVLDCERITVYDCMDTNVGFSIQECPMPFAL